MEITIEDNGTTSPAWARVLIAGEDQRVAVWAAWAILTVRVGDSGENVQIHAAHEAVVARWAMIRDAIGPDSDGNLGPKVVLVREAIEAGRRALAEYEAEQAPPAVVSMPRAATPDPGTAVSPDGEIRF